MHPKSSSDPSWNPSYPSQSNTSPGYGDPSRYSEYPPQSPEQPPIQARPSSHPSFRNPEPYSPPSQATSRGQSISSSSGPTSPNTARYFGSIHGPSSSDPFGYFGSIRGQSSSESAGYFGSIHGPGPFPAAYSGPTGPSTSPYSGPTGPSTSSSSGPTDTRYHFTPAQGLTLDAPTTQRPYPAPSAATRNDISPSTSRPAWAGDEEDELDEPMPDQASELQMVEWRRRQNTLAARKSRQRKLKHQLALEESVRSLSAQLDVWKTRALTYEALLRHHEIPIPSPT